MECPATPPDIADCALLRTPSPTKDEYNSGENRKTKRESLPSSGLENEDNIETNTKNKKEERCNSPDPGCAICLGQIENMSYTDSCFHKFCFTCLLEWSKVRPVCPLCKARFKSIIHTIQSDNVYESYTLPPPPATNFDNTRQEMQLFLEEIQRFRQNLRYPQNLSQQFRSGFASFQSDWRQRNRQEQSQPISEPPNADSTLHQVLPSMPPFRFPSRTTSAGPLWNRRRGVATSAFRRNIYRQNLYVEADSIIDITGRVRECNADWYRNNQAQTHRLVAWLNRELLALMETQAHQVAHVMQLILDLIQRFNIQSPEFHEQMVPYTGTRTTHFQHEFYNFARSTYDMIGYDRHAMYTSVEPVETYVVSSDTTSSSSEDEVDVQVDPSPSVQNRASMNAQVANDELIVVDDLTPQIATSSGSSYVNTGINEPMASTSSGQTAEIQPPFPLIISSGESDINQDNGNDDVEIVNYVKPRKDRTPVIVNIDSSDDDIIKKRKEARKN